MKEESTEGETKLCGPWGYAEGVKDLDIRAIGRWLCVWEGGGIECEEQPG